MSRAWNGESLVSELSSLLGDTSTAFQAKVLGWLNDTIFDIGTRNDWGHLFTKGKKKLAASTETHSLEVSAPVAPTVAASAGGSLTDGSVYYALATFTQSNGVESVAGTASSSVTVSGGNLTISLTSIPISSETLVTGRNIYLKKDSGKYYFHGSISNNSTTTYSISSNTTSIIEPPDYESVRKLSGSPFFEGTPSNYLSYRDIDQLRLLFQGQFSTGTPEFFSMIDTNSITAYPIPSSEYDLSFNYYRYPARIYATSSSQPDLPIYLKPALKAGVIALGYEYRDRSGQENKKANYEMLLREAINQSGKSADVTYTVRDIVGNSDGFEVI